MAFEITDEDYRPVRTIDVLCEEFRLIWSDDKDPPSPPRAAAATGEEKSAKAADSTAREEREGLDAALEYYRARVAEKEPAALCLSGGGIRSASFALGVMEALSARDLLTKFHYLSTVSGGGYIGGWLQRWIYEEKGDFDAVMKALKAPREPVQVKHLRENSNFLTPRVGVGSNDTWAAVAICIRNIVLNWLLFGPMLMLAALLPAVFVSLLAGSASIASTEWRYIIAGGAGLAAALAGFSLVRALPSYRKGALIKSGTGDGWLMSRILLPLLVWVILSTLLMVVRLPIAADYPAGLVIATIAVGGGFAGMLVAGLFFSQSRTAFLGDALIWLISLLAVGGAIWLGTTLFDAHAPGNVGSCSLALAAKGRVHCWETGILAFAGPVWLLASQFVGTIVFVGLRFGLRGIKPDADREWLARVSAIKVRPILVWLFAAGCGLILNWLLGEWLANADMSLTSLFGILTGWMAAGGGKSRESGGAGAAKGAKGAAKMLSFNTLVALATFLFLGLLFVLLGRLDEHLVAWLGGRIEVSGILRPWRPLACYLALAAGLGVLLFIFSKRIKVNRFSLNGLYRNRLDRGFLGAAREKRLPDPFTGFNSQDNVRMNWLVPGGAPGQLPESGKAAQEGRRLYPVINVTLNATESENLAWQERKATSFIFTPLYSGSASLDPVPAGSWTPASRILGEKADADAGGAYISSTVYGGNEPDYCMAGSGISLASAMSISGAAASPAMGYHTSSATAFLMTLFNVRLGTWLPNPARANELGINVGSSNPSSSLGALLREMAGLASDEAKDIYLSDGGHFENLAVYEMLRRRCRYIVVTDAGADPECTFFDLGGLVRKAKIDFDTVIDFPELRLGSRDEPYDPKDQQLAWAFGTIKYPNNIYGQILYLKPSFFGEDLPADIRAYGNDSKTFPHETTGDQFFSESQFESYRHLGFFFMAKLAKGATDIAGLFKAAPPLVPAPPPPPPPSKPRKARKSAP
ncbi:MAG: hypothetical protein QOH86_2191 [Sphingomonadales bacterium]|nr:hypothetical protein [Sphingomonadales bacterium]